MHRALALCLLLLVLPVQADPGHGFSYVARDLADQFQVNGTAPLGLQWFTPGDLEAGDLVLINVQNQGPDPLIVQVSVANTFEGSWIVPADHTTHVLQKVLARAGAVSMDLLAQGGDVASSTAWLFVDYTADCGRDFIGCHSKILPWEVPSGRIAFPVTLETDGAVQTTVSKPDVHDLQVSVLDAALRPIDATVRTVKDGYTAVWSGTAGVTYFLVVDSVASDPDVFFAEGSDYYRSSYVEVDTGPVLHQDAPGPSVLWATGVLTVLTAALTARSRGTR